MYLAIGHIAMPPMAWPGVVSHHITQSMLFLPFWGAIYPHSACGAASVSRGPSGVGWIVCVDDYRDQERNSLGCQLQTNK